ncbi:MAG TPA: response regulator [Candidatus Saccharimonadales bacterium]|nr:response regulator [Candidatus Saccharimonadales bacterium]
MEQSETTQKIVIVEDNGALAEIYKTRLEALGYTCFIAYNGITGLYFIQKELPNLVLLDLMVPDIAGDQILTRMRSSTWGKDIPVYVISNLNEADAPQGLRDLGISGYSVKANLANDQIDQIVNNILRPGQPPEGATPPSSAEPEQAEAEGMHQPPEPQV